MGDVIDELVQRQEPGRLPRLTDRERRRAETGDSAPVSGRYLEVEDGDEIARIRITAAVTKLGRSVAADVHLDDPTVSRRHALIVQRHGEAVLLDDRSMNGTWLNGERIREARLAGGDVVELGAVRLVYVDVA
jgi:pSer/pThr/pTyr-binding forkhead associated (FHA) protein